MGNGSQRLTGQYAGNNLLEFSSTWTSRQVTDGVLLRQIPPRWDASSVLAGLDIVPER